MTLRIAVTKGSMWILTPVVIDSVLCGGVCVKARLIGVVVCRVHFGIVSIVRSFCNTLPYFLMRSLCVY